jgi:phosphoenolpyruvate synthase/pyruvate phosphate dikinase
MKYLVRFDDEDALDAQVVGQKFHALAKAAQRGFAVPQAVAVSASAHRFYLTNHCWPEELLAEVINAATALDLSRGLSKANNPARKKDQALCGSISNSTPGTAG